MKKNLLSALLILAVSVISNNRILAQSTLIYYWNFNITDTTVTSPHTPQFTATGAGSASIFYYYDAGYIDFTNPGTFSNAQMGADSGWSLRLRTPADSMIINMPTTGYANIHFSFATERSGSGPSPTYIYYSNDGTTFLPTCVTDLVDSCVYTVNTTWDVHSFTFAADAGTVNNPHFAIKIAYTGWGAAGNNRFDNFALKGDVANPSLGINNFAENVSPYSLSPNPATNTIDITSDNAGSKNIIVTNAIGQKVITSTASGTQIPVNIAGLASGVYYMSISENGSSHFNTLKFIKQ